MKRERRLRPIHTLAEQNEQGCATRLVQLERRLADGEQRYAELLRYRMEYEQAFNVHATSGATMRGLREQQVFIARLGEAVRAQQGILEQLRADCQAARTRWREAATRRQVIGRVIEHAHTEETMKDERRSQRELDELANRPRVRR